MHVSSLGAIASGEPPRMSEQFQDKQAIQVMLDIAAEPYPSQPRCASIAHPVVDKWCGRKVLLILTRGRCQVPTAAQQTYSQDHHDPPLGALPTEVRRVAVSPPGQDSARPFCADAGASWSPAISTYSKRTKKSPKRITRRVGSTQHRACSTACSTEPSGVHRRATACQGSSESSTLSVANPGLFPFCSVDRIG